MQVKEIAAKCVDKFKSRPEEVKKAQIARSIQKKIELYGDGGNGKKVSETKKLFSAEKKAEIRKRREATLKEKYGVSCSFHTETARHKSSAARLSKAYDEIMSKDKYVEAMFSKEQYIADPDGQLTWKCRKCGKVFHSIKRWHYSHALNSVARCLDCYPLRGRNSSIESQFADFIESLNVGEVIRNTRDVIPPRELDIYLPERKTAVEFNGLRWHSLELGTELDYHMSKSDECAAKGVFLLHIFENEWIWNKETTQKYIQTALGVFNRHEDTNNCICQEIDSAEQNIFYAENSIAFHEDMPTIGLKKNGELLFCCQYEKQNGIIVVKNAISKSGVQTHKALDACIDLIEQTMRPKEIHILIDRRLQQMPKLTGYDIIESKSIPPAKFFYTLADKKHLIPEQSLSQDASVMFTHFNAGYFLFTVKRQNA